MKSNPNPSKTDRLPKISETSEPVLDDYPLDLVAKTAAALLRNDDYKGAVSKAFLLLQECTRQVQEHERRRAGGDVAEMRKYEQIASEHIPVTDFLSKLTGQKNSSRAKERFTEALPWAKDILTSKTIERREARKLEAEYTRTKPQRRTNGDNRSLRERLSLHERFLAGDDERLSSKVQRLSKPPKNSDKK